ncbi:NADH-ubiquinone oxidoreductase 29.9 kd subunit precursor [Lojkania enalia]|uniref:NADH-ubiquinone oxidoreductase 29.9 kd subunit n=1 Tax=Lojkania enalia TaxID=147567 RepID=A0A9P4K572_9PLEO|nr:NADH-ubiquinone oxidoreductase 29.9 kd subunit precursor [Didymosphaeria enalia]
MRAACRLFAAVKHGQYLEAGAPTGLTGLTTHPSPRSALLYYYSSTLDKLQKMPESSVYRQSTEALTKHRLSIVEQVKPAGYDAWLEKVKYQFGESPQHFKSYETSQGIGIALEEEPEVDPRSVAAEWDGEMAPPTLEGPRTQRERRSQLRRAQRMRGGKSFDPEQEVQKAILDPEPQLTAEQISDIESRIGAGLIEEVIQVAEGEHKLASAMIKSKAWEALEEPAPEGQWSYFERSTSHHTTTQKP